VENDRRALNVFFGMRRAKKEGRWMGCAPIGFINKTNEHGRKYISPSEPEAGIMKWAFQELANGLFAADQIRKEINNRGIKCSRSNFWRAIRNPVYCGKIEISQFKDEENITVPGQHEGIISEALFYEVQSNLTGRKRNQRPATQITVDENMPLRGFLICPKCGRMLTGSASTGRNNRYYYYHCISLCGCRFKTENANSLFVRELRKYVPQPGMDTLYIVTLKETYSSKTSGHLGERRQILSQIDDLNIRLKNARELIADGKIDDEDYRELKKDCTLKITILESKLSGSSHSEKGIDGLLKQAIGNLSRLDALYVEGTIAQKRQIIGSIYPEKLVFDGFQYRTARLNEAVRLICTLDKSFSEMKNRKGNDFLCLSGLVPQTGIEPVPAFLQTGF
jgi:site-specific DNA recombinase